MARNMNNATLVNPAAGKGPGEHVWTHGADVQSLWKRHGWTPPSKSRRDYSQPATACPPQALQNPGS